MGGYGLSQIGSHGVVSQSVSRNQAVGKQSVKREEKSVLKRNYVSVGPIGVVKDSKGSRPIYIKYMEGLGSPKATPNLDVESRGPNYTTIYLPYPSRCPLTTSKTLKLLIFKIKAQQVIVCVPYLYHKPEMVNEETPFQLNKTVLVRLAKQYEIYQTSGSQIIWLFRVLLLTRFCPIILQVAPHDFILL